MSKENLFSEIFSKHTEIVQIDREEENAAVEEFQKTGDKDLLDKIYIDRIPTLKNWALKYYYPGLELSIDDFMEELSIVFVKAASKYDRKKGAFNTCLYTYLNNRIKNMKNSTHAKKRRPENYEGPLSGIVLSLDHSYSNDGSGGETTLKDILAHTAVDDDRKSIHLKETIDLLSSDNPILRNIFVKLGEGNSLSSIMRDSKTRRGSIEISKRESKKIKKSGEDAVKDVLLGTEEIEGEFTVKGFALSDNDFLRYEVEYKRTEESEVIRKTIDNLRKNKRYYIEKIKGY